MTKKGILNLLSHHHSNDDNDHHDSHHDHHHHHRFLSMLLPRHHHTQDHLDHNHKVHNHDHAVDDDDHQHRHGMKSILSHLHLHLHPHHHRHHHRHHHDDLTTEQSVSATVMEENINVAEPIVLKWDDNTSPYAKITWLFSDDRAEAHQFLRAVAELQAAMLFFVSSEHGGASVSRSHSLARAQTLMQTAMRRLEREFYQILSANRDRLDPESISTQSSNSSVSVASDGGDDADEELRAAGDFISEVENTSALAMTDLRDIADAMISAGYGKECVQIYRVIRKSIVDEGLYRLGFENHAPNQIQKLEWEALDLKIRSWTSVAKVAVKTLFSGERILCDHVFGGSEPIRESCFADVARDAAVQFLGFAESVTRTKRSPEKLFRMLELYDTISDLCSDIATIFSFESTAAVRSQAITSLQKLSETTRSTLNDFESTIQKDASKIPPPGAGIHPLTSSATIYITSLADYEAPLAEILEEGAIQTQTSAFYSDGTVSSPSTASFSSNEGIRSTMAARLARLLLVLICKLDSKAGIYKEGSMTYLFLANNLWFISRKVKESKLGFILGEEWVAQQAATARQHAGNYQRAAWGRTTAVAAAAEGVAGAEEAWEKVRAFNVAFEETMRSQGECVIADAELREEVRASIAGSIVPGYRILYDKCCEAREPAMSVARYYSPDDVWIRVSGLFENLTGLGHGSFKVSPRAR
ncbi:exocyst complex component EXO70H1-like [Dioscorea cayenensis subsp. rotundata]|uniref:Exocyst subunit Exo70 family protein n=1 Tax=Dioscorea cayennensis subsp. rotundata TaxID=55577 RepID=A0AB40CAZ0_DIOCR|nr:exocyst complex component EXO70H1-like [Dioscorea cayenensis subsp. rotundata]